MPIAKNLSLAYNGFAMISVGNTSDNNIKTAWLDLNNGWSGKAALYRVRGKNFSQHDWNDCLAQPNSLFDEIEKIIKMGSQNCVAIKKLPIRDTSLQVVIKRQYVPAGFRQFFRSFRPGKALRNIRTALRLKSCGIEVASPFAALQQRFGLRTRQSIYITEFITNSSNLHAFASGRLSSISQAEQYEIKTQISYQLAAVLASLHSRGLWHRDSKASNFVVYKDSRDKYKILLADMDGIKRYILPSRSRQLRPLWHLAASLLSVPDINRTDYLRTFYAYCDLTGLDPSLRRTLYRLLARRAQKKRMRKMAASRQQ
jgi:serine/threonine protein kinase